MKPILIRGIDKELWKRFRGFVVSKYGKSRKKHSLVAQELNELIERYLDGELNDMHGTDKLRIIKQNIREAKKEKGSLTKKDVDVAIAKAGICNSRTAHSYIWNLENIGFFKKMDLKIRVPPIVKYSAESLSAEYSDDIGEETIKALKNLKKKEEMMYA